MSTVESNIEVGQSERFAVIIAGCRWFEDLGFLTERCDYYLSGRKPTSIICGESPGVDTLGKKYAQQRGIPVQSFPANWVKYGKGAGMIRNSKMADHADALIAFWDGKSPGTKNMIEIARDRGIPYRIARI